MIFYWLAEVTRVIAGDVSTGTDHIKQVAVVAGFLAEAENTDVDLEEVEIVNRDRAEANAMSDFYGYARECKIKEISAIPYASQPLPISVLWDCTRFIEVDGDRRWEERNASFWVQGDSITKIAFGRPKVISLD